MAEYPWRPLGELLVRRGLIDEYQLEAVLLEQRLTGQLLGELLVARRLVSPLDMAVVVAEQHGIHLQPEQRPSPPETPSGSPGPGGTRKWRPLGRILVEKGLLTESGLQRVLLTQRRRGGPLGGLLLERGYITPEQLADALAEQHGLTVDADQVVRAVANGKAEMPSAVYEVRHPGAPRGRPLHISPSFLDASDFAFELLYEEDPDALEIVEVTDGTRRVSWSYRRPPDEVGALGGGPA